MLLVRASIRSPAAFSTGGSLLAEASIIPFTAVQSPQRQSPSALEGSSAGHSQASQLRSISRSPLAMARGAKRSGVSPPPTNTSSAPPSLSSLTPKPCQACGRQITPRAKWARNWDEIRFCSDRCRAERSVVLGGKGLVLRFEAEEGEGRWMGLALGTAAQRVEDARKEGEESVGEIFRIDIDAWAEEALLRIAAGQVQSKPEGEGVKGSKRAPEGWAKVSDAERVMREEAREVWGTALGLGEDKEGSEDTESDDEGQDNEDDAQPETQACTTDGATAALSRALGPALRERVRRAARRRVILDPSLWARQGGADLEIWGTPVPPSSGKGGKGKSGKEAPKGKANKGKEALPGGAKRLQSLEDVSFARGDMFVRVDKARD